MVLLPFAEKKADAEKQGISLSFLFRFCVFSIRLGGCRWLHIGVVFFIELQVEVPKWSAKGKGEGFVSS